MNRIMAGATLAATLLTAGASHAAIEKAGTTAANFLSIGSGAGVLGMGGAVLGWGGDLNAAAWNPGALGWMSETQMVLSHSGLADDQAQEWAAAGGRFGSSGTHWALSGLYHGQGSFEGRDATGTPTGTFEVSSMAVGGQIAQRFGENATIGIGAKYVSEDLGSVRGSGLTFDVGAMLRAGRLGFGFAAQNVGGSMSYDGASYPFPTSYGAGASVAIPEHGLRFALDANFPDAYYSDVRGGVEWMWREAFALRAGYRAELGAESGEPLSGPSFGMGAGLAGLWFDYGYLISGMGSGGEHRVGITLRPGSFGGGAFGRAASDDPVVTEPKPRVAKQPKAAAEPARSEPAQEEAPKSAKTEPAKKKAEAVKPEPMVSQPVEVEAVKPAALKPEAVKPATKKATAEAKVAEEPPAAAAPEKTVEPEAKPAAPKKMPTEHKVRDGDTLYSIAKLYGTTVPKIMEANNMVNENIQVGQKLKLPKR